MITAQTSPAAAPATPTGVPERPASLAAAIDAQAQRVDQLSAAIIRATAQVTWSGRAADRFRVRAAERARECLQLAVALRASAERVHAAAAAAAALAAGPAAVGSGHALPHTVQAPAGPIGYPGPPGPGAAAPGPTGAAHPAAGSTVTLERSL